MASVPKNKPSATKLGISVTIHMSPQVSNQRSVRRAPRKCRQNEAYGQGIVGISRVRAATLRGRSPTD
jgi:hypothetical protein